MIHYRNLAILGGKWDRAVDQPIASEAAREGEAATQANMLSNRIFPLLGDTAQTG
jgi:hypothetical protein